MFRRRHPRLLTHGPRRGRASVLLEFMMIMPLFLFLVLFSVDMGRLMVVYGAVGDATYVAARAGAQYGTVTVNGENVAQVAFDNALRNVPGLNFTESDLQVLRSQCTNASSYIVVQAQQTVPLITPGLGQLLGSFGAGDTVDGEWVLQTRAAVLCEVVRG